MERQGHFHFCPSIARTDEVLDIIRVKAMVFVIGRNHKTYNYNNVNIWTYLTAKE